MTADQLAKEIIAVVNSYRNYSGDFQEAIVRDVSAKLAPLVKDAAAGGVGKERQACLCRL